MNAVKKLELKNQEGKFICVGLDSDRNKIPKFLLTEKNPVATFNELIIDATKEYAAAYKINLAFYEGDGLNGVKNIEQTLKLIPSDVLTIADGKRGDIKNSSTMYAKSIYEHYNFDSATLNAYMGYDSVDPFINYKDKLNFVLALTSNPGSSDFQKLKLESGEYLFQFMIKKISEWNKNNNCGIVFGATKPEELKNNVSSFNKLPVLLPGVGSQGGDIEQVAKIFSKNKNQNFLVNVSRGIIYSGNGSSFATIAKNELIALTEKISKNYFN